MKNFLQNNRQLITGILVGTLSILLFTSIIVEKRLSKLQGAIEISLNTTSKELNNLAGMIARGEANALASQTIANCTVMEQTQFDNRLGSLDSGLSPVELNELDTLFSRCAPVFAIRRSAMVVQLDAEVKKFTLLLEQRNLLGEYSDLNANSETWKSLLANEKKIVELHLNLVNLQYEIIKQLLLGVKVDSEVANELKNKGQLIRTELKTLNDETAVLREGLI